MDRPFSNIEQSENNKNMYKFCTYVSIISEKRMNLPAVFIKLLDSKNLQQIFLKTIDEDNIYNGINKFLQWEPGIMKSKHVTKYLNKKKIQL